MKLFITKAMLLILIVLSSCKKDKTEPPAFSAEGYWRGVIIHPYGISMLNYPNGMSRLYILTGSIDTAHTTTVKGDGTWKIENGKFSAEYPRMNISGPPYSNVKCEAPILNDQPRHLKGVGFIKGPGTSDGTFVLEVSK